MRVILFKLEIKVEKIIFFDINFFSIQFAKTIVKIIKESNSIIEFLQHYLCVNIIKNDGDYEINFQSSQLAITPGQSIVFYRDDIVLGGGIIERKIDSSE